jgi:hypothetical protein
MTAGQRGKDCRRGVGQRLNSVKNDRAVDQPSEKANVVFGAMFPQRSTAPVIQANLGYLPDPTLGGRALAQDVCGLGPVARGRE